MILVSSPENAENEAEEEQPEDGRRAITYQIAKNKGLTPHRKKEQRNPRVKHRKKFEKARIRRKGQVYMLFSNKSISSFPILFYELDKIFTYNYN